MYLNNIHPFPKEVLDLKGTTGLKRLRDPIQPICGVKWEQGSRDDGMSPHAQFTTSVKSICGETMDTCYTVDES